MLRLFFCCVASRGGVRLRRVVSANAEVTTA